MISAVKTLSLAHTLSRTPELYFKTHLDRFSLYCFPALVILILVEVDTLVGSLITRMCTLKLQPRTDRNPVIRITSTWADKTTNQLRFSNTRYCWEDFLILLHMSKALCNMSLVYSRSDRFRCRWTSNRGGLLKLSRRQLICACYTWSAHIHVSSRPFQARLCTLFLASQ